MTARRASKSVQLPKYASHAIAILGIIALRTKDEFGVSNSLTCRNESNRLKLTSQSVVQPDVRSLTSAGTGAAAFRRESGWIGVATAAVTSKPMRTKQNVFSSIFCLMLRA